MHAASRAALAQVSERLDAALSAPEVTASLAAQIGSELFDVAALLDGDRALRTALADSATSSEQRVAVVSELFGGKVAAATLELLQDVASQEWSAPRELTAGLISLGRRSLLRSAESQNQLEQVEAELFQLSRLLNKEGHLTQLLGDRVVEPERRRGLLAQVLYGKVLSITESLALQAVAYGKGNPVDILTDLASDAASLRGRSVAFVQTPSELNEGQRSALAEKLARIYGREVSIHSEVEPSLLGGMVIRVGDEVIDGSTKGKIARLRASVA